MKLDKTKPYGIVAGHPTAAFVQNGVLFGTNESSLVEEATALPAVETKPTVKVKKKES